MSKVRRILLRATLCIVLAVIAVAGIGAWLVRSDPSWYHHARLTEAQKAAAERSAFDKIATLRNNLGSAEAATRQTSTQPWPTFDIELTEDEVNGPLSRWSTGGPLAHWSDANPQAKAAIEQIEEPHVRFLKGRIVFAGRSTSMGSLVSIELGVEQPDDGPPLVTLGRPWAGRMPLSRSIVEEPAARGIAALRKGVGLKVPVEVIDSAEQLAFGKPTTPVIVVMSSTEGSGLIAARVERLVIEDGLLRATLRPLPSHPKR